MKAPICTVVDFETYGIEARPVYPPIPTSCSLMYPGKKPKYLSWGQEAGGNNVTKEQAYAEIKDVFNSKNNLLFQNAKFDTDVAVTHIPGVRMPSWDRIHDTLPQLFLRNPYARSLSLKPSAYEILGLPPEEQDKVKDWIIANVPEAKKKKSEWGAHIWKAPGTIVGPYANGDVVRTKKLHDKVWLELYQRDMIEAYNRERRLMPILLRNEQEGMRVDLPALERDIALYTKALDKTDAWLRKRLKTPGLNVDADAEWAKALKSAGVVTAFILTKTGKDSVSKKNLLPEMYNDKKVYQAKFYRDKLATYLRMFMLPWFEQASQMGGFIHTSWNQVRGEEDGGARTGRMSSSPNFQNVPRTLEEYPHPNFIDVPRLPIMRRYLLPDSDEYIWMRRDCNQQELRLTAHYEDGSLQKAYNDNPRYDVHALVQQGIFDITGMKLSRPDTKVVNFQDIYGGGVPALMRGIGCTDAEARAIKKAKRALMPDFEALSESIKQLGRAGGCITTIGGREYYCEEPAYSEKHKRMMTWEYKLLNYLIQGSAADMTKEILIRYDAHPLRQARLMVCVHDEFNSSAHKARLKLEMKILNEVIQSFKLDVPVLSDGEAGPSWGNLKKYDDVNERIAA